MHKTVIMASMKPHICLLGLILVSTTWAAKFRKCRCRARTITNGLKLPAISIPEIIRIACLQNKITIVKFFIKFQHRMLKSARRVILVSPPLTDAVLVLPFNLTIIVQNYSQTV